MNVIKDLDVIQNLDQEKQIEIVGGKTGKTEISGGVSYKPIDFPTCPLYRFPDGTIGHYCPGDPYPNLPSEA
jgi:hypothetical protein